jgi:hypothetical protein
LACPLRRWGCALPRRIGRRCKDSAHTREMLYLPLSTESKVGGCWAMWVLIQPEWTREVNGLGVLKEWANGLYVLNIWGLGCTSHGCFFHAGNRVHYCGLICLIGLLHLVTPGLESATCRSSTTKPVNFSNKIPKVNVVLVTFLSPSEFSCHP